MKSKKKSKKQKLVIDAVKAARKQSREEEIATHGKPLNFKKVVQSKKVYNRKKNKAEDDILPYFFVSSKIPV